MEKLIGISLDSLQQDSLFKCKPLVSSPKIMRPIVQWLCDVIYGLELSELWHLKLFPPVYTLKPPCFVFFIYFYTLTVHVLTVVVLLFQPRCCPGSRDSWIVDVVFLIFRSVWWLPPRNPHHQILCTNHRHCHDDLITTTLIIIIIIIWQDGSVQNLGMGPLQILVTGWLWPNIITVP